MSEFWISIGAVFGAPLVERPDTATAEEQSPPPKELP